MYLHRISVLLLLLLCTLLPCRQLRAQQDSSSAKSYEQYENQPYGESTSPANASGEEPSHNGHEAADTIEPPAEERYTDEDTGEEQTYTVFSELHWPLPWKERTISAEAWLRMSKDPAFVYTDPKATPPPARNSNNNSWWLKLVAAVFSFLSSEAGKIIIVLAVALLVVLLIIRIIQSRGNIFFSRKDKKLPAATDELADDYVPPSWEQAIQDAAATGNYRLAVRHSYRYLLNLLQEKELIAFQTAKTNYQYAFELSGNKLHQPFLQLTRGYEYAWYGGFPITRERFEAYYQQINGIKQDLR